MSPAPRKKASASGGSISILSRDQNAQALAFSLASLQEPVTSKRGESIDDEDDSSSISTPAKRLERCRERNREHARRTRIRKKVQLEALQKKCKSLQEEQTYLKQSLEDRRVASILLNLSGNADPQQALPPLDEDDKFIPSLPQKVVEEDDSHESKKKRKMPQSNTLCISIDGVPTVFSSKSHVNWKTGAYVDSNGEHMRLNADQLESLRRERNRLHAKMTRDRKKCFLYNIQREIDELERENERLRELAEPVVVSPELTSSAQSKTTASLQCFLLDT